MSGGVTMYANDTTVMVIGQTRDKLKKNLVTWSDRQF